MEARGDDEALPSIETFATTCAKLAQASDRASVLGDAGLTEDAFRRAVQTWTPRMSAITATGSVLAERFGQMFAETLAGRQVRPPRPEPTWKTGQVPPPAVVVASFMVPTSPAPARTQSPWACTVAIDSIACRPAVPFRPSDERPAIAAAGRAPIRSAGTGTVPLPEGARPPLPAEEDDTEPTLIAPPVGQWRPVKK